MIKKKSYDKTWYCMFYDWNTLKYIGYNTIKIHQNTTKYNQNTIKYNKIQ